MISTKHKWLCDIFSFSLFFWGSRFKTNASRIGFEIIPFLTVLLVKKFCSIMLKGNNIRKKSLTWSGVSPMC
jgi:hypothetical protein